MDLGIASTAAHSTSQDVEIALESSEAKGIVIGKSRYGRTQKPMKIPDDFCDIDDYFKRADSRESKCERTDIPESEISARNVVEISSDVIEPCNKAKDHLFLDFEETESDYLKGKSETKELEYRTEECKFPDNAQEFTYSLNNIPCSQVTGTALYEESLLDSLPNLDDIKIDVDMENFKNRLTHQNVSSFENKNYNLSERITNTLRNLMRRHSAENTAKEFENSKSIEETNDPEPGCSVQTDLDLDIVNNIDVSKVLKIVTKPANVAEIRTYKPKRSRPPLKTYSNPRKSTKKNETVESFALPDEPIIPLDDKCSMLSEDEFLNFNTSGSSDINIAYSKDTFKNDEEFIFDISSKACSNKKVTTQISIENSTSENRQQKIIDSFCEDWDDELSDLENTVDPNPSGDSSIINLSRIQSNIDSCSDNFVCDGNSDVILTETFNKEDNEISVDKEQIIVHNEENTPQNSENSLNRKSNTIYAVKRISSRLLEKEIAKKKTESLEFNEDTQEGPETPLHIINLSLLPTQPLNDTQEPETFYTRVSNKSEESQDSNHSQNQDQTAPDVINKPTDCKVLMTCLSNYTENKITDFEQCHVQGQKKSDTKNTIQDTITSDVTPQSAALLDDDSGDILETKESLQSINKSLQSHYFTRTKSRNVLDQNNLNKPAKNELLLEELSTTSDIKFSADINRVPSDKQNKNAVESNTTGNPHEHCSQTEEQVVMNNQETKIVPEKICNDEQDNTSPTRNLRSKYIIKKNDPQKPSESSIELTAGDQNQHDTEKCYKNIENNALRIMEDGLAIKESINETGNQHLGRLQSKENYNAEEKIDYKNCEIITNTEQKRILRSNKAIKGVPAARQGLPCDNLESKNGTVKTDNKNCNKLESELVVIESGENLLPNNENTLTEDLSIDWLVQETPNQVFMKRVKEFEVENGTGHNILDQLPENYVISTKQMYKTIENSEEKVVQCVSVGSKAITKEDIPQPPENAAEIVVQLPNKDIEIETGENEKDLQHSEFSSETSNEVNVTPTRRKGFKKRLDPCRKRYEKTQLDNLRKQTNQCNLSENCELILPPNTNRLNYDDSDLEDNANTTSYNETKLCKMNSISENENDLSASTSEKNKSIPTKSLGISNGATDKSLDEVRPSGSYNENKSGAKLEDKTVVLERDLRKSSQSAAPATPTSNMFNNDPCCSEGKKEEMGNQFCQQSGRERILKAEVYGKNLVGCASSEDLVGECKIKENIGRDKYRFSRNLRNKTMNKEATSNDCSINVILSSEKSESNLADPGKLAEEIMITENKKFSEKVNKTTVLKSPTTPLENANSSKNEEILTKSSPDMGTQKLPLHTVKSSDQIAEQKIIKNSDKLRRKNTFNKNAIDSQESSIMLTEKCLVVSPIFKKPEENLSNKVINKESTLNDPSINVILSSEESESNLVHPGKPTEEVMITENARLTEKVDKTTLLKRSLAISLENAKLSRNEEAILENSISDVETQKQSLDTVKSSDKVAKQKIFRKSGKLCRKSTLNKNASIDSQANVMLTEKSAEVSPIFKKAEETLKRNSKDLQSENLVRHNVDMSSQELPSMKLKKKKLLVKNEDQGRVKSGGSKEKRKTSGNNSSANINTEILKLKSTVDTASTINIEKPEARRSSLRRSKSSIDLVNYVGNKIPKEVKAQLKSPSVNKHSKQACKNSMASKASKEAGIDKKVSSQSSPSITAATLPGRNEGKRLLRRHSFEINKNCNDASLKSNIACTKNSTDVMSHTKTVTKDNKVPCLILKPLKVNLLNLEISDVSNNKANDVFKFDTGKEHVPNRELQENKYLKNDNLDKFVNKNFKVIISNSEQAIVNQKINSLKLSRLTSTLDKDSAKSSGKLETETLLSENKLDGKTTDNEIDTNFEKPVVPDDANIGYSKKNILSTETLRNSDQKSESSLTKKENPIVILSDINLCNTKNITEEKECKFRENRIDNINYEESSITLNKESNLTGSFLAEDDDSLLTSGHRLELCKDTKSLENNKSHLQSSEPANYSDQNNLDTNFERSISNVSNCLTHERPKEKFSGLSSNIGEEDFLDTRRRSLRLFINSTIANVSIQTKDTNTVKSDNLQSETSIYPPSPSKNKSKEQKETATQQKEHVDQSRISDVEIHVLESENVNNIERNQRNETETVCKPKDSNIKNNANKQDIKIIQSENIKNESSVKENKDKHGEGSHLLSKMSDNKESKILDDSQKEKGTISYKVGDLTWARLGCYPYWPCMITESPEINDYKKVLVQNTREVILYHVRFFGDKGRRAWIKSKFVMLFRSKNDLQIRVDALKNEGKNITTSEYRTAHFPNWRTGVDEAESLKDKSAKDRLDYFRQKFDQPEKQRKEHIEEPKKNVPRQSRGLVRNDFETKGKRARSLPAFRHAEQTKLPKRRKELEDLVDNLPLQQRLQMVEVRGDSIFDRIGKGKTSLDEELRRVAAKRRKLAENSANAPEKARRSSVGTPDSKDYPSHKNDVPKTSKITEASQNSSENLLSNDPTQLQKTPKHSEARKGKRPKEMQPENITKQKDDKTEPKKRRKSLAGPPDPKDQASHKNEATKKSKITETSQNTGKTSLCMDATKLQKTPTNSEAKKVKPPKDMQSGNVNKQKDDKTESQKRRESLVGPPDPKKHPSHKNEALKKSKITETSQNSSKTSLYNDATELQKTPEHSEARKVKHSREKQSENVKDDKTHGEVNSKKTRETRRSKQFEKSTNMEHDLSPKSRKEAEVTPLRESSITEVAGNGTSPRKTREMRRSKQIDTAKNIEPIENEEHAKTFKNPKALPGKLEECKKTTPVKQNNELTPKKDNLRNITETPKSAFVRNKKLTTKETKNIDHSSVKQNSDEKLTNSPKLEDNFVSRLRLKAKLNHSNEHYQSDSDSKASEVTSVQLSLESQIALYRKNNIFRGVPKERICQICQLPDNVVRCKGKCNGVFHTKCIEHLVQRQLTDIANIDSKKKMEAIENKADSKQIDKELAEAEVLANDLYVVKKNESSCTNNEKSLADHSLESSKRSVTPSVEIVSVKSRHSEDLPNLTTMSPNFRQLSLADQIDYKMKEIMDMNSDYQSYCESADISLENILENELKSPDEDEYINNVLGEPEPKGLEEIHSNLSQQALLGELLVKSPSNIIKKKIIKHVTADDVSFITLVTKSSSKKSPKCNIDEDCTENEKKIIDFKDYKCGFCTACIEPNCFVCRKVISKRGSTIRQICSLQKCGKYYHPDCLKKWWPQTQWSIISTTKHRESNTSLATFVCPQHVCHTCASDDPRGANSRCPSDKLAKCLRCPAAYHCTSYCVPAGTDIPTFNQIVCPRHIGEDIKGNLRKPMHVINTMWCFICSEGGDLICCETCPTSVHSNCLPVNLTEDNTFVCEDCESGRFPLYDEIVWVKLGAYRWWPAVILFPGDIPANVMNLRHSQGEFVVKFFGTSDHYWVSRGRTFLFQEGDQGHSHSNKKKIDTTFTKAIEEAAAAHELKKRFKMSREAEKNNSLKPPPYIKIKVNKPVGNVRQVDFNVSNTTSCDCDPNKPHPCGPDSDCLNRLLMTECNPQVCLAGNRCNNQCFEKREYPPMVPYKTEGRGWGLKTLAPIRKGQFVVEYVGEIIDEQEYQRRIKKMHEQKEENYYFLTIDKDRMLDAGPKGNVARFMNHSCQPNCETQKWTVNGDTRVGLFANQDIPTNSELTFNYNLECVGKEMKVCRCGAPKCNGFIGVKAKSDDSQKKVKKSLPKVKRKKVDTSVEETKNPCFVCGKYGEVGPCSNKICMKYFHLKCVDLQFWPEGGKWVCPWHNCNICSKRTIRCCVKCINSYCPPHSEGNVRYDNLLGFVCTDHDPTKSNNEIEVSNVLPKTSTADIETDESTVTSTTSEEMEIFVSSKAKKTKRLTSEKNFISQLKATSTPLKRPAEQELASENTVTSASVLSLKRKRGRPRKSEIVHKTGESSLEEDIVGDRSEDSVQETNSCSTLSNTQTKKRPRLNT